jgi:hypothetical protein
VAADANGLIETTTVVRSVEGAPPFIFSVGKSIASSMVDFDD